MRLEVIDSVYFVGIGGIGMSAIARYFKTLGKSVAGYDKTESPVTQALINEEIDVTYTDSVEAISEICTTKERTLVVYTPAIPADNIILNYFKQSEFEVLKRSEVLGLISKSFNTIGVAGTHGKTSVTTLLAYLLHKSSVGCNAFLGGISKNFETNLVVDKLESPVVVEADEFDRSFLRLSPKSAIITSMDADHLDIYNNHDALLESFNEYANKLPAGGNLLIKKGLETNISVNTNINSFTYSIDEKADFYAENIRLESGRYLYDFVYSEGRIDGIELFVPGLVNVENSVAAIAMSVLYGVTSEEIITSIPNYSGVQRRFDYRVKTDRLIYIDDYAHHPTEIAFTLRSIKSLYPGKKIAAIFQPHLYSRTNDFAEGFATELDKFDDIALLDIYPARELPIEGVTSAMLINKMSNKTAKVIKKEDVENHVINTEFDVMLTIGAGDIDRLVKIIEKTVQNKI